jgi:hypothetical protein
LTTSAAASGRWRLRQPSVIPGFGLTLGFSLAYSDPHHPHPARRPRLAVVLIPLSGLVLKAATLGFSQSSPILTARVNASLKLSFGTVASSRRRSTSCFGRHRRLGAGALRLSLAAASSMPWSTCPSRCRRPSPASRSPALCAEWLARLAVRPDRHQDRLHADRHRHRAHLHRPALRGAHRRSRSWRRSTRRRKEAAA